MALWLLVNLGTRCTVTHCRIALWRHQSAQTASSDIYISTATARKGLAMSKPVSSYLSLPAQPFLVDVLHILVMQCFRMGYRGICHASLVFFVYTRAFRRVCIRRKYKWQVACSTVSHEKALHNYFIPCLNLRKVYGLFWEERISENFGNASNPFLRSLNDL